jgi:hypothetical protein
MSRSRRIYIKVYPVWTCGPPPPPQRNTPACGGLNPWPRVQQLPIHCTLAPEGFEPLTKGSMSNASTNCTLWRRGDTMWYAAGKSDFVVACRWHYTWMLSRTTILGKLACLVLSKNFGIGTAKRNWKQEKKIKYRDRDNLENEVTAKITTYMDNTSR